MTEPGGAFPRANPRGPIEALLACRQLQPPLLIFPRANPRGPIEAANINKCLHSSYYFRGLIPAAPLKRWPLCLSGRVLSHFRGLIPAAPLKLE